MSIFEDIKRERALLVKATFKNKLAKRVKNDILLPILNEIEKEAKLILEEAGNRIVDDLIANFKHASASDKTYMIYTVDPEAPRGQQVISKKVYIPSKTAGPPFSLTGSLIDSLSFRIDKKGAIEYGILKPNDDNTFASMAFFPGDPTEMIDGKIYVSINDSDNKRTPVRKYGSILDDPTSKSYRPWFDDVVREVIRPNIRKFIRDRMKEALKRATKRPSVNKAIVFKVYFRDG